MSENLMNPCLIRVSGVRSLRYLKDVGNMLLRTIVSLKSDGGVEIERLFGGKSLFPNPKPTSLIELLINSIGEKDGLFVDFFSGSATMAHAILNLNSKDGGKRRFILIQLPEDIKHESQAYQSGYENICNIGEERIRRAGKKIKEETNADIDYGFRCFKVDSTNMKEVYYRPADVRQLSLDQLTAVYSF